MFWFTFAIVGLYVIITTIMACLNDDDMSPSIGAFYVTAAIILLANLAYLHQESINDAAQEANTVQADVPTALDVYRGNTALQVTYKDSIPVDTLVVFKD